MDNVGLVVFVICITGLITFTSYNIGHIVGCLRERKRKSDIYKRNSETPLPKCTNCNKELNIDDDKIRPCLHCMDKSWKEGYEIGGTEGFNKGKIAHIITEIKN